MALTPPEQWRTFFEAAIDVEESAAWFETFLAGPKLRGKKRNVYDLVNGQRHDKYGVILSGFNSVLPPLTFTSARLMEEIQVLVAGQAPGPVTSLLVSPISLKWRLATQRSWMRPI